VGTGAPAAFVVGPPAAGRPLFMLTRFEPAAAPQPIILGLANVFGSAISEGLAPGEMVSVYSTNLGPPHGVLARPGKDLFAAFVEARAIERESERG
jgi:hypothetical protein